MAFLDVLFTMDCEAISELSSEGGPPDWEFAMRAISGFCDILFDNNLPPTLFIVPQTAAKLGSFLMEMREKGAELALHYHPQDHGYGEYLGAYEYEEQKEIIAEAVESWSSALGIKPLSFRGGNLSANDSTFPVLSDLGFKQGSLSVPGRSFTRLRSNWESAPMNPYRTNRSNRLIPGGMDFLEIPITADWESTMWGGLTKLEFRLEMVDARAHGYTIRKNVDRQLKTGLKNPYLLSLTHNIFDYSNEHDFRREVLFGVIDEIMKCAKQHNMIVRGHTLTGYRDIFNENLTGN